MPPAKKTVSKSILTQKFIKTIQKRLLTEKEERLQRPSQHPEIDADGDETDVIQANIQIELHNQFVGLNNDKLAQIEEALGRIKNKIYGICIDCDEIIPEKRLMVNPYYQTCVSCAEDRELEIKRSKI